MLKTGICNPADLRGKRSVLGRPKRVSLGLLTDIARPGHDADRLFGEIMAPLRLANGTYRTTARHRFRELDPVVNGILPRAMDCSGEVTIHDWATSDGSAAMEWAVSLARRIPRLRFNASDKALSLVEARSPSNETYFCEPDGEAIQYVRKPFVLSFREPESAAYPVNRCMARWARRNLAMLREVIPHLSWTSPLDPARISRDGWTFSQQPLLHPAVRSFADANEWFQLQCHSVFDVLSEHAHVIRTMNILNRAYFSPDRIGSGIRAVYESLRPGGLWIVGRSQGDCGGAADTDILQKLDGRFELVAAIGAGSEIRDLVEKFAAREPVRNHAVKTWANC